jgi:cobalamin synthase
MAFATVYFISSGMEPICWLVIFAICAYLIAKYCTSRYFLHGLLVSMVNSVWITGVHILLFKKYLFNHPQEANMLTKMPMPDSPRLMMLMTGPFVGIVSGLILGLFALIASKFVKKYNRP